MASGGSPSPTNSSPNPVPSQREIDLQRKRERDRKSQQAMRDRNKWTINNLSQQVAFLSRTLEDSSKDAGRLNAKIQMLENENEHLRVQNAALRLSLMGDTAQSQLGVTAQSPPPPWEIPPTNTPPSCMADQILQGFVSSRRRNSATAAIAASERATAFPLKPNLCSLLDKDQRTGDETSNIVGDIVRSYTEIETLPKQVAVHYVMSTLLKWMVFLDEESWDLIPLWLRPVPGQITTPHAAWVDRIPWPKAREYLLLHPSITLDDFAAVYSSSFFVRWDYDPSHVLITTNIDQGGAKEVITNPIYEEHIRQLKNWSVGEAFRKRFPDLAKLIDEDTKTT